MWEPLAERKLMAPCKPTLRCFLLVVLLFYCVLVAALAIFPVPLSNQRWQVILQRSKDASRFAVSIVQAKVCDHSVEAAGARFTSPHALRFDGAAVGVFPHQGKRSTAPLPGVGGCADDAGGDHGLGEAAMVTVTLTSIDRHGRLVLVPSKVEPEALFRHRPRVKRVMSLEDMDRAIAAAAGRDDP